MFAESAWPIWQAQFRNGDIQGALQFCGAIEPGSTAPWRDELVSHAAQKFRDRLVTALTGVLGRLQQPSDLRTGALHLAGHLADGRLADALRLCWDNALKPPPDLGAFIWAAARCGGDSIEALLAPMCDAWGALPSNRDDNKPSPREGVMAHGWAWAIWTGASDRAVRFFIQRAGRDDLAWPITYMLYGMDNADVVEFLCRQAKNYSWFFSQMVLHYWDPHGLSSHRGPMSIHSRQRLFDLWVDAVNEADLRDSAFKLWAVSMTAADPPVLQSDPAGKALFILRRSERG